MKPKHKAILYIITAAFCFTWLNIFVRLSGDLPSIQKSFFRNLVAALTAAAILLSRHESFRPGKGNLPLLLVRSTFGTIGILGNFYAVDHLLLANASMLNKMSPFFVLIFSVIILKERLTLFQLGMVVTAFIGSLFVIKPVPGNMELVPSLIGLVGGMSAGIAYTIVRKLSKRGERGPYIVFFFSAFSCLAVLPWILFNGVPMTLSQVLLLTLAGVAAAGGQFAITAAYSLAPGREVSVYDYSQIIFSALFGLLLFGDVVDGWSLLGDVIMIGAAVALFIYNNRRPDTEPAN